MHVAVIVDLEAVEATAADGLGEALAHRRIETCAERAICFGGEEVVDDEVRERLRNDRYPPVPPARERVKVDLVGSRESGLRDAHRERVEDVHTATVPQYGAQCRAHSAGE